MATCQSGQLLLRIQLNRVDGGPTSVHVLGGQEPNLQNLFDVTAGNSGEACVNYGNAYRITNGDKELVSGILLHDREIVIPILATNEVANTIQCPATVIPSYVAAGALGVSTLGLLGMGLASRWKRNKAIQDTCRQYVSNGMPVTPEIPGPCATIHTEAALDQAMQMTHSPQERQQILAQIPHVAWGHTALVLSGLLGIVTVFVVAVIVWGMVGGLKECTSCGTREGPVVPGEPGAPGGLLNQVLGKFSCQWFGRCGCVDAPAFNNCVRMKQMGRSVEWKPEADEGCRCVPEGGNGLDCSSWPCRACA
jgi:hypothetical protein